MARGRGGRRKHPARGSRRPPPRRPRRSAAVARKRRGLSSNINYQYWIQGFQEREAKRTGKLPSPEQVRRNKNFQKWVDVLLGHKPGRKKPGPHSKVARALVELGIRDPAFKGAVGNSPGKGSRRRSRRDLSYSPRAEVARQQRGMR